MKMIKNISKYAISLLLLVSSVATSFGQQDPMYSQYMFNIQAYNPAYTGTWESIGIMALGRHQWVGFKGGPETYTLTIQAPLRKKNVGLGLSVMSDDIGFEKRFAVFTDYSYRFSITNDISLRLGLKAGFTNYENNLYDYTLYIPGGGSDPAFEGVIDKKLMPNFGVGAFMYSDRFYAGFSIPKILQNDFDNDVTNYTTGYELRHFTLIGGYVVKLSDVVKFKPSFNARYIKGSPIVTDINASFLFADRFWIGAMYRTADSFGFNTQFIVNRKLRLGYAIDFNTSDISSYNDGIHEVMISYELNFVKTRYTSPRYF
ncbi:type IX secretion system membrane protein PorP/SprF [Sunxiuqinia elliptica]|uniref:Type IX secretion system PorP/SprF family membrane protein n=1 Tax=Sunxiuqinia elliptica TaxID=655355 RepID=A0A4R6H994_9BACT|nr:type IX secretion system membrane protein PorP/SprF [Sunxiuqinia elliptica]TDO04654.1 type IX secretion system PorP/SprF family membrane protein [Sunxiuqinia elliptica]TDO64202.1 type IX secretion system PorP/SprF family membrane protein [Sunxiuqinia elliptica]